MNVYLKCAIIAVAAIVAVKLISLCIKKFRKKKGRNISLEFACRSLQAFTVILAAVQIGSSFPWVDKFYNSILMSSSLIIVVLGFVLQQGLSNIVHGLIISIFKPFNIGDRVHLNVNGVEITGYITSMNLRNTVLVGVQNSSHVIIPNSLMDTVVVDNFYTGNFISTNYVAVGISYNSDVDLAINLLKEITVSHPLYTGNKDASVFVSSLNKDGAELKIFVTTRTIEDNFKASSDIRYEIIKQFKEKGIYFNAIRVENFNQ